MLFVLLFDTSPSLTYSERFSAAGQITAEYFAFFFFLFESATLLRVVRSGVRCFKNHFYLAS